MEGVECVEGVEGVDGNTYLVNVPVQKRNPSLEIQELDRLCVCGVWSVRDSVRDSVCLHTQVCGCLTKETQK